MHTTHRRRRARLAALALALLTTALAGLGPSSPATAQATPAAVTWTDISVGYQHACGVVSTGAAYCWGGNGYGNLGNGTSVDSPVPVPVTTPAGVRWASITAGGMGTCAVTTTGAGYCWGADGQGQLGNGAITGPQATPSPIDTPAGKTWASISVSEMYDFYSHACGITTDGAGYCWGDSGVGALGTGVTDDQRTSPTPIAGPDGVLWDSIETGITATCGVDRSGGGWCWGHDGNGILGNGGPTDVQNVPDAVEPDPPGVTWKAIVLGNAHACGLAVDGTTRCWGGDFDGQLGNGAGTDSDRPTTAIAGTWSSLSAFGPYSCGVTTAGAARCWGKGLVDTGGGAVGEYEVPTAIPGTETTTWPALSVASGAACGITAEGRARCWGHDIRGKLGDGPATSDFPTEAAVDVYRTPQTIDFADLTFRDVDAPSFTVTATASSGLPVTFTASGGACTVSGATVDVTDVGTCTITATQAGDALNAAATVERAFTVHPAASGTVLAASRPLAGLGDEITFAATVTGHGAPTGQVTFTATPASGAPRTGTAPVGTDGVARWKVSNLPAGTSSVVAAWEGNSASDPSTSTAVTVKVLTAPEEAVYSSYRSSLGRDPDVTGLTYWTDQLTKKTPTAVADAIARSREGRTRLVTLTYQTVLQWKPAPADRDYWVDQLVTGGTTPEGLTAYLYSTVTTTPVDALYRVHLGWTPTASERDHWGPRTDTKVERKATSLTVGRTDDAVRTMVRRATTAACGAGTAIPTGAALTAVNQLVRDSAYDIVRVTGRVGATHCPSI